MACAIEDGMYMAGHNMLDGLFHWIWIVNGLSYYFRWLVPLKMASAIVDGLSCIIADGEGKNKRKCARHANKRDNEKKSFDYLHGSRASHRRWQKLSAELFSIPTIMVTGTDGGHIVAITPIQTTQLMASLDDINNLKLSKLCVLYLHWKYNQNPYWRLPAHKQNRFTRGFLIN